MATKGKNTVEIVEKLLEPIVKQYNVLLYDIVFEKEGASWFLRVFIDKDDNVSFEDCENVSRALDKKLDEVDPIEQSYFLEVSSAGLERQLTKDWHFDKYKKRKVVVKTIRPMNDKREFYGELLGKDGVDITIIDDETKKEISFKKIDIVSVKLFEEIEF